MFNNDDLVKYKTYARLVDQLDWVIKGEAVIQTALLKQWFIDLEKKIKWGIDQGKPKPENLNIPGPIAKPLKVKKEKKKPAEAQSL